MDVIVDVAGGSENVVVMVVVSEPSVLVESGPGPSERELSPIVSVGCPETELSVVVSVSVSVDDDESVVDDVAVDESVIDADVSVDEEEVEEEVV